MFVAGGVERRVAGEVVGLEQDARVAQHAAGRAGAGDRLRIVEPGPQVDVRNHVVRPGREERILGDQQHAVGRAVVDRAVLAGVDDHAHRVRHEVEISPRVRQADVVVAAAGVGGVVEEGVAGFDVAALGLDERGDAEDVGGGLLLSNAGLVTWSKPAKNVTS